MAFSLENQFLAFLGSSTFVLLMILTFLVHKNKGKTRIKEGAYLKQNRLAFPIIIMLGQIVSAVKEYLIDLYVSWQGEEETSEIWEHYFDGEEGISFLVGFFCVGILNKGFKIGNQYLKQ